jgi:2-keto-3-deoxy-L-rhamnonate aldolase RhmA
MAFLEKCKGRSAPLGVYLGIESPFSAHVMSSVGYDWVFIDMEHSPLSARETTAIVHAVANGSDGRCTSLVRVPSRGVEWVKWALDAGANGIVVPMVQSAEEARQIVKYAKYPPVGQRSFGPFNAPYADPSPDRSIPKYVAGAMQAGTIAVIAMIESRDGIENAEAIMSTKGIDGIFVGPVDMRLSLGLTGADGNEAEYLDALKKIVSLGKKLGLVVGILAAGPEALKKYISIGFDYFLVASDSAALTSGAKAALDSFRTASNDAKL